MGVKVFLLLALVCIGIDDSCSTRGDRMRDIISAYKSLFIFPGIST